MNRLKLFMAFICLTTNLWATTYYVSTTGVDGAYPTRGTLANPWRTLSYAASYSNLLPGDIVYVKAGNYGNENVVFTKSGTIGNPIIFQGYKTNPGDAPPVLVNNVNPFAVFDTTNMPTFTGSSRATGMGFTAGTKEYLVVKNFQIQDYAYGFHTGFSLPGATRSQGNLVLENINVKSIGNINVGYAGVGFALGSMGTAISNHNTITNCLVVNSAAEGFGINGDYNQLTGCKVYCNQNTASAATDYYILVWGSYNTISNCHIDRATGLSHYGHGMGVKGNEDTPNTPVVEAKYNTFNNNTAVNMGESFYVRHRTVKFNNFNHCKAFGTHTGSGSSGDGYCIMVRDGASFNNFDGCIGESCAGGIVMGDSREDEGTDSVGHPNNYNKIVNCLFYNCYSGVYFNNSLSRIVPPVLSEAGIDTIANCTFNKTRYMIVANRPCTNIKFVGNIFYGTKPVPTGTVDAWFQGGTYSSNITASSFKQCDFYNIWSLPAGYVGTNGNIGDDPSFVNAAGNDFHLNNTSTCIDKVDAVTLAKNPIDFDGKARYNGAKSDIGAFEYYAPTINTTICKGLSTSLTSSSSALSYSWAPSAGLSATTGATVMASPLITTTYTVTCTYSGGGTSTQAFAVTVNTVSLSASAGHSAILYCGTCINGGISLTGANASGQLANGTTTSTNIPVFLQGLLNVTAVSAGQDHTLFLKSDGTVWASGYNGWGQLGDGTNTTRTSPVQITSLSNIIAIAAGAEHSLFLKSDGTVWSTGSTYNGRLGDGGVVHRNSPVQVSGLTGITAIAAGAAHSLFLKSDGTVKACGKNTNGQLGDGTTTDRATAVAVSSLSNIKVISAGANHSLFLENAGTVKATGLNTNGQLGDGSTTQRTTPVAVSTITSITEVAAGGSHSLFLQSNNHIWGTGANTYGQLGDGTTTQRTSPVLVSSLTTPGVGIRAIAAGANHSLFLENDGSSWASGLNWNGQLGDGTNTSRSSAVQIATSGTCGPLGAPTSAQDAITSTNSEIIIYPNPADGEFSIRLPEVADQETTITLFDVLGRAVVQNSFSTGDRIKSISSKELEAGIYVIQIQTKNERVQQKIVIEHENR